MLLKAATIPLKDLILWRIRSSGDSNYHTGNGGGSSLPRIYGIPLMGDIRTNQGDGFTYLYHAAKFGTKEGMWWASE